MSQGSDYLDDGLIESAAITSPTIESRWKAIDWASDGQPKIGPHWNSWEGTVWKDGLEIPLAGETLDELLTKAEEAGK